MLGKILLYVLHCIILYGFIFHRRVEIIQYGIERNSSMLNGFETSQGMVDANK